MFIKMNIPEKTKSDGTNFYMGSVWYNKVVNFENNGSDNYIFDSRIESNPIHINVKEVKTILSVINL